MFYSYIKRILDLFFSVISLIVLWPFFFVLAILIKIDSKGPVFFKQKRIGKDKKEFYILKFRTMRVEAPRETPTHMLQNPNNYITKIGLFIRKTSLDELPQIFNIIKGEMSIIGPRPALWNQYDLIAKRDEYDVNAIYPGLTGWAQINGRDELPLNIKVSYDAEYVNNMSFVFDIKVFILTIFRVIKSDGIREGVSLTSLDNNK
ncbi:sugar transferase [Paenibacillus sp. LHD-38]|uniref:sugar transferase n=1 Tax=Paenibacillus sp. LHD-38 TaxID=3072143 RepID=UPI0028100AB2|nr:sugar transferase [Paenibacillus sp. LHD-38]MDQ8738346.1 sugar transferase [Paenibacillus sp. LHD-38]